MEQIQEKKLGRGLSALFGESKPRKENQSVFNQDLKGTIESVSIDKIVAGIYQPRQNFDKKELEELAKSIKENGLIQPILLRKTAKGNYEIIAGERRFRAAKIAGLKTIAAVIREISDHEALEFAIIENVQRSDLSLIEEANSYKQLIGEFSYTQEQIGKKLGKSRSHVANLLRLLSLPQNVQEFLDQKLISMGHARAIINSNNPEKLAKKIIADSLTVRDAENMMRDEKIDKVNESQSKTKLINSKQIIDLEKKISSSVKMDAKILYNSLKGRGKIIIKFDDFEKVKKLINNLRT